MAEFTHIDDRGRVRMVDVTDKPTTDRTARARAIVRMKVSTVEKIRSRDTRKGNVLETARIAGILAAKKTGELIPMCHPLNLSHVSVDFTTDSGSGTVTVESSARLRGQTGVEMEALTAAAVAALTIYDMCKSYDRAMVISDICLVEKTGGKSGPFHRDSAP